MQRLQGKVLIVVSMCRTCATLILLSLMSLQERGLLAKRYVKQLSCISVRACSVLTRDRQAGSDVVLQDLDAMRQDLATYASDLKVEQDHAVSSDVQTSLASTQMH